MTNDNRDADGNYVLSREQSELASQHEYLREIVCDGRLIIDESVRLGPNGCVLDAGTGSGAWLLDLSKEVPNGVNLHGVDVSLKGFPSTYPSNVHFLVGSMTELPLEWTEYFDLVNQRLLVGGILASEWPIALAQIFRVMKPGAHAQFVELDLPSWANGGPEAKRWAMLCKDIYGIKGLMIDCGERLPTMLKEAGFSDVTTETKLAPAGSALGRAGQLGTANTLGALRGMKPAFLRAEIFSSEKAFEESLKKLEREWEEGEGQYYAYRIVCGRKA
ncbi:S-adenosyl-L-methionine-dependent methyltransferase [Phellopilus nigrolimitatus]|nr:S-adenosyl-L-methionine-dependent methyltransferase [Phellopilus nigrolimitatus]